VLPVTCSAARGEITVLPDGIDEDKIEANFAMPTLTVKLPKTVGAQQAEKKFAAKAA
jgi:HSP20 family protein